MTARTRNPEATRALILEAAEEVFLERGFGNASMSEIAKRAGVTKSLIHHHFGSKDGLWDEVKTSRFSTYVDAQMALLEDSDPSADLLRSSMEAFFGFHKNNPQMVRILAWVFLEQQQSECLRMDVQLIEAGTAKIREAQENGEIRADINPAFILFTMVGIVQHWFQDRAHMLQHLDPGIDHEMVDAAYLNDVLKIFFDGILPR